MSAVLGQSGYTWRDFCKIFISNNPASIRNHELGQRHKDNVANRLTSMRQVKAAKKKEQKEATHVLEQIEAKRKEGPIFVGEEEVFHQVHQIITI
ncbi:hypothetical protein F0562_028648 [Nyssa sinensis]|uniref:U1-C C2H2-type zinc finger domain-containing protein n=1 Tax=Nyssa sinensis TaxID=561372 RepID=A0A5J5B4V5_9ASTE|nr:hypothetical protein F0562_028648 [Nyssa sinensis]